MGYPGLKGRKRLLLLLFQLLLHICQVYGICYGPRNTAQFSVTLVYCVKNNLTECVHKWLACPDCRHILLLVDITFSVYSKS